MAKLALKVPGIIKTVVSIEKDVGEIWYARPISLGLIKYEGGYWFTIDRMRFMSSRDAMEYLIRTHELRQGRVVQFPSPEAPPKQKTVAPMIRKGRAGSNGNQLDPFVIEILDYLREHPDVQKLINRNL